MDFNSVVPADVPVAGLVVPVMAAVVGFSLLILERIYPLRKATRPFLRRFMINTLLTGQAIIAGGIIVKFVSHDTGQWASAHGIGLLRIIKVPFSVQLIIGFLLLDLTFYYWHRVNHTVPLLWRFHNTHHTDPDLDVTTSLRFHVLEVLYSAVFRVLQILLIGASPVIYFIYEGVFQVITLFHHSNLKLPVKVERVLNKVFVTPRMHGIHHSDVKDEAYSNYSVVFRWWDMLHSSLRLNVPQSEISIGVPAYRAPEDNSLRSVMLMPFQRQRDYWTDLGRKQGERVLDNKRQHRHYMAE
jgi:sterol desaturase/sphingolipid hydroxylase (fatty acid hydroxylase superfamily)